mmetsp:Transcript_22/g.77  ORF Transcript_22/g.77 Transcript_22/m.77 type:complete len:227 (-) Transcript_22:191-871(-)
MACLAAVAVANPAGALACSLHSAGLAAVRRDAVLAGALHGFAHAWSIPGRCRGVTWGHLAALGGCCRRVQRRGGNWRGRAALLADADLTLANPRVLDVTAEGAAFAEHCARGLLPLGPVQTVAKFHHAVALTHLTHGAEHAVVATVAVFAGALEFRLLGLISNQVVVSPLGGKNLPPCAIHSPGCPSSCHGCFAVRVALGNSCCDLGLKKHECRRLGDALVGLFMD